MKTEKPKTMSFKSLVNPTPRQEQFWKAVATHDYVLYGGAAGGGKSYILRWTLIALLLQWFVKNKLRNVKVGLFCESYPALEDRQISRIAKEVPDWLGKVRTTQTDGLGLHLRPEYGGGVLLLRNLDRPEKYKSVEFAAIAVDELTENEEGVFHDLRFRLRWPGIERPKFLAGTNPTGVGHLWVKRLWVLRQFAPEMIAGGMDKQFAYVPAMASDNSHLTPAYYQSLLTLPPLMRKALAEGSWDIFAGQVFAEFDRRVHVVDPIEIPPSWPRWVANDIGFASAGVWLWFAAGPDESIYVYREMTFRDTIAEDQARRVVEESEGENIGFYVVPPDGAMRDVKTGKSILDFYAKGGITNVRAAQNDRLAGCLAVHNALRVYQGHDGRPAARLRLFSHAEHLIETLPALVGEPDNPDIVLKCSTDHWYDALRYGLLAWHGTEPVPQQERYEAGTLGSMYGTPVTVGDERSEEELRWEE